MVRNDCLQDINVRKNQQMLSSFFFSACEVLKPGQIAYIGKLAGSHCHWASTAAFDV